MKLFSLLLISLLLVANVYSKMVMTRKQCPGGYFSQNGYDEPEQCQKCPGGSMTRGGGATKCTPCQEDEYSDEGISCAKCPQGSEMNQSRDGCNCYAKNSIYKSNNRSCFCNAGMYGNASRATKENQDVCKLCPFDTQNGAPNNEYNCQSCNRGEYSPEGSTKCFKCPQGSTGDRNGFCRCYESKALPITLENPVCKCPEGTRGDATQRGPDWNQSVCQSPCDRGSFYDQNYSRCMSCNFFGNRYSEGGYIPFEGCKTCPQGAKANGGGCTCIDFWADEWTFENQNQPCRCRAGYYGNPISQTSERSKNSLCTKCPKGKTSLAGATQESECF